MWWQVRNTAEQHPLDLAALTHVGGLLQVRARPRPRPAGRDRSCAYRIAPSLRALPLLSCWRVTACDGWQVSGNTAMSTLDLRALMKVDATLVVRVRPRPRSADRVLSRAHRAEPSQRFSWRVTMLVAG